MKSLKLKLASNNDFKWLCNMLDAEIKGNFHFIEKKLTELAHNASTNDQRASLHYLKYKTNPQNHTGSPEGPKKARRYV